jgi:hypothetical protein
MKIKIHRDAIPARDVVEVHLLLPPPPGLFAPRRQSGHANRRSRRLLLSSKKLKESGTIGHLDSKKRLEKQKKIQQFAVCSLSFTMKKNFFSIFLVKPLNFTHFFAN